MALNGSDEILVKTSGGSIVKTNTVNDVKAFVGISYPNYWYAQPYLGNIIAGSAWTSGGTGFQWFQSPSSSSGSAEWGLYIAAGTYQFFVLCSQQPNAGIIKWSLDGVDFLTGQDWYGNPGTGPGTIKTGTCVILSSGYHKIKYTVTGKNASASDYYIVLNGIGLKPATY